MDKNEGRTTNRFVNQSYLAYTKPKRMRKLFLLFAFVLMSFANLFAQDAQLTFSASTNFKILEDGFHPVKFELTNGSNANVAGLLAYVQNNPNYFKVQVNGNQLTLHFVEGLDWGVWMKVFGSMGVSQIEISTTNQNSVVDPMGFLEYFHLIKQ